MIFESLWPLLFLAAVPIVILLYLLKPRGKDYRISSHLLWKKILLNEQSKTFFEKFTHNLLMYVQILIIALLVIALMSPYFHSRGQILGKQILLIDTSASMQHEEQGKTRFEQGIQEVIGYIRNADQISLTVITCDARGPQLLAVDISDKNALYDLLRSLSPSDCAGNLSLAQGTISQLCLAQETENPGLLILTDADGAKQADTLTGVTLNGLWAMGNAVSNVANHYTAFSQREDGTYDIMVSTGNYSDSDVTFDVSLFDADNTLLDMQQLTLSAGESDLILFSGISWNGESCKSMLSGFTFANAASDSLPADNSSYAIKNAAQKINGLLIGEGNTYLEKAYQAVTGDALSKSNTPSFSDEYNVLIYDSGFPSMNAGNSLVFLSAENKKDELEHILLSVNDCDLTYGIRDFTVGVNRAYTYEVPSWGIPFLVYEDECLGYYGEHDGIREVCVGFDIRESDFPLKGEFPIFLANAVNYLSNTAMLSSNVYYAGENLLLNPWANPLEAIADPKCSAAGLYRIADETHEEYYTVRFQSQSESDGRNTAENYFGDHGLSLQRVKHTLRTLFLVLALLLLFAEMYLYVRQTRYRGVFYYVTKGLLLVLILLALFDVRFPLPGGKSTTIFLVDLSDSNESHQAEMSKYLQDTIGKMPSSNQYGILCFGKNALVEQFLTGNAHYSGLLSLPEKTATNFEDALSRAIAMLPDKANARLVILTDGKQTRGDIQNMASSFNGKNIELLSLRYQSETVDDVYIDNVIMPSYLHPGDQYQMTVVIESNFDTDGVLKLYHSSELIANNSVHLNKGTNRFVLSQVVSQDSLENLLVTIEADGDSIAENNQYHAYSVVEAPPRILVISGKQNNDTNFNGVLHAAGLDYSIIAPHNAPSTIDDMLQYKSIVLVNTYYDELSDGFLENLEPYVRDYGCGFVCTGGLDSYALGGYRDTALERVLPVSMTPNNVNESPSMAMVMVIDRSGSMSGSDGGSNATKLDLAIKATTVAIDNLRSNDYVGVITFDTEYDWVVPLTENTDPSANKKKVEGIKDGGGTTIKPSLDEACDRLSVVDATLKHVVLLTDGQGETDNYDDVIANYQKRGITLSTVAVGSDADNVLLSDIARRCGGRSYTSTLSSDLPRIFAQEVYLGGGSFVQEGNFTMRVRSHTFTQNLYTGGYPVLHGYISTSPKTSATLVMSAGEKDDPILTTWQYGLGRTVAWCSDVSGEWSRDFSGDTDNVQLWKRIIEYTAGNINLGDDQVSIVTAGEQAMLSYDAQDYQKDTKIYATLIDPDGETTEVPLLATAPGKFQTTVETPKNGLYHYNIRRTENDEISNYITTASAVQFSDEYKFKISTDAYDSFIAAYGKEISTAENIWKKLSRTNLNKHSVVNFLLGLSILLFVLDIALRRFQYVPQLPAKIRQHRADRKLRKKDKGIEILEPAAAPESSSSSPDPSQIPAEAMSKDENEKKPEKKAAKPAKKKEKKEAPDDLNSLDTSLLLKKKDDRNL